MSTLKTNTFTHAIARGDKQIGQWISLCSNFAAEVTAPSGYDWAVLDMEHTPSTYMTVLGQLQAYSASKTVPLVRVEWNDKVAVKRLLDMGAPGLVFPMIETVEEAQAAVAATRYPPHGVRGFSGGSRATQFGRVTDYLDRVEAETTIILQLESRAAIAQAEAIASVDGVDGIFFGPADIAADIGLLGKPLDPGVWDVVRPAVQKLNAMGMPAGTLVMDPAFAAELLNDGFTFVACGIDSNLLARASDAALAKVKAAIKT